ncbi:MAG: RecX family transcriptional regulator, partial [Muribaculaceae bacterium]|nr:RecX family transcriptional regulator [Muribaculaceae bacterium]
MKTQRPITPEEAQARLEALCARAEHSTGEMAERLRRWQIGSTDTERILASLKEHRFVDDRRFARAYVTDKVKFARWGKRKVYQGLLNKHVAPE